MSFSTRFAAEIMDLVAEVDALSSRRTFGALGLYSHGTIFGMIADETLYLRLDAPEFNALRRLGGQPLRPVRRKPDLESANYVAVPPDILDDHDELLGWVRRAVGGGAMRLR